ncbi:Sol3 6-phosphogluconolactonase [Candida orthopsilosis Co 90-125]|uniref:6-phosphogluconolactonase-like protein n=1 Tax=Candida orthopsilosis (strain 90-125) TaxID=1136231 RepID=H8X683_CANO9|nr:Sol3 6-phosphogluconolactonase [Candida orthopsilosis Co 90-125]CCG23331.1 Sol3 6-phosphogluconolactonase [Candida orthopsilosis Co 90-125]
MTAEVYSYSEQVDLANAVGKYIVKHQNEAIKANGSFKIALSGGSLGKVLKEALIDNKSIGAEVQWDKWGVYFSDERLVPLNHKDSNYGLFNEMVLENLPSDSAKPNVHTIDESLLTGKDGQIEGADVEKDKEIAKRYAAHLPHKFDVILLGCGPDGHTCSLFPGHKLLDERAQLVSYVNDSPKPPPRRITITFPVLESATAIAFVAQGSGKAPILKEIFNDPESKLPSKLVTDITSGTEVSWFVDSAAIEGADVLSSKY